MPLVIAIHPDDHTDPATPDKCDSSSPRWAAALQEAGHQVRWVDVRRADILDQLKGCHGFMWRWVHSGGMHRIARRLLPVLERECGLVVYPDQHTCWHYDDKIAQAFLLEALGVPTPTTWVWFDRSEAECWAREAEYPVVLKLYAGAGSTNVRLIHSSNEAQQWIARLFTTGVSTLQTKALSPWPLRRRISEATSALLRSRPHVQLRVNQELHKGYALFQEFLPHNPFDTRITVIGNRAFGYRRFNRENDFRASGSGNFDTRPHEIDPGMTHLAFETARKLQSQSVAIDGLRRDEDRVVGEVSYTYVSWMVHACPGHWELHGDAEGGELVWCEGRMWPEEAQARDFIERLEARYDG